MAFDGIVTKSVLLELQSIIGYKIDKVSEPDKNTIILGLYGKGINISLLSCISSNNCRLHLTSYSQKNPLNAPNFCMLLRKHLLGMKIKNIYSYDLERIVFIDLENLENYNKPKFKKLIIELMGKHSNIILTDENNIIIDSMRHTSVEDNSTRDIYPTSKYIFPESKKISFLELKDFDDFFSKIESTITESITSNICNIDDSLDISSFDLPNLISSSFNGISSYFIKNMIKELNITKFSKNALYIIYTKLNEIIFSNDLTIIYNTNETSNYKDYYLWLDKTNSSQNFKLNYCLDDFYFKKESSELFKNYRNSILNLILATLKKYEKRLINIDKKLLDCKDMDKYRLYGELITSNLYRIQSKNIECITLENYYDNNCLITIPLDKQYSPSYNAKKYFKKYSKLKNALEIVALQKEETIKEINYIESIIYELESSKTTSEVDLVFEEISESPIFSNKLSSKKAHQIKKNKKVKNLTTNKLSTFNPLKYIIDGYTILVGRNNVENDYLTCKYAKKTDIWFHTKDIHGSHVILKVNQNEKIPNEIIYEAAKLAVSHSKAKNSSNVPVDYCKVSFVKKPSGSKPGFVIYSNNKTIYI